ncbi:amidohydrolase family protein [Streptomyces sp. NPDC002143]
MRRATGTRCGKGFWGPERVARLFPARRWIDLGAQVGAGSDFPVGQFGAMRSVYGMTTRQTVIGVKGPEHAITYDEALTLHTANAARLLGEEDLRGTLTPGRLADLTIWDQDPAHATGDAPRDLHLTHTFVGGLLVTPTGAR